MSKREGSQKACPACGEKSPANFKACWSCGADLSDVAATAALPEPPQVPAPADALHVPSDRQRWWFELAVVFVVALLPALVGNVLFEGPFGFVDVAWEVNDAVWRLGPILLVVYLLWRGGRARETLGLGELPSPAVLIWILLLSLCGIAFGFIGNVLDFVLGFIEPGWVEESAGVAYVLPFTLLVAALEEELVFRVFLWTRLTQLTGSPRRCILYCALLFAFVHDYGPGGQVALVLFGLAYGYSFWARRSLVVVVLAHWLHNVLMSYSTLGYE